MVCFRCLVLPLPLTWSVGTFCQASQLWISDCIVTSAVTRVTSWSLSPGYKSVETRGLIFLCCEHKPGEMGRGGVTWYLPAAWKDQCYHTIRTSLEESTYASYHLSLKSPLWGWGPAGSLSVSRQPLVMGHVYPTFTIWTPSPCIA